MISVYRLLKDYFTSTIATDNSIDAKESRSILQSSIIGKGMKTSLNMKKQPTHCHTCGSLKASLEANQDMVVSFSKTSEDFQNRRMEKIESNISWLLKKCEKLD